MIRFATAPNPYFSDVPIDPTPPATVEAPKKPEAPSLPKKATKPLSGPRKASKPAAKTRRAKPKAPKPPKPKAPAIDGAKPKPNPKRRKAANGRDRKAFNEYQRAYMARRRAEAATPSKVALSEAATVLKTV